MIDCGKLSVPADGSMDDSQGTKYQAQVTFHCNDGYLLVGNKKTTCSELGEWTNPAPTCVKKCRSFYMINKLFALLNPSRLNCKYKCTVNYNI